MAWSAAGSLRGPQGLQGAKGAKGDTGDQGPQGDTGATGPPGSGAAGSNPFMDLSRWGLLAANGIPGYQPNTSGYGPAAWAFTRLFVPAGVPIGAIVAQVRTAGSGSVSGQNGFAVYEISGSTINRVATTSSDATIWTATAFRKKSLSSVVPAQASDREVMIGCAFAVSSAPTLYVSGIGQWNARADNGAALYLGTYVNGALSSWAASYALTSLGTDSTAPWIGIL